MAKARRRKKRFEVQAGREIYCDGQPYVGVTREGNTPPTVADRLTHKIAALLNRSRATCR